MNTESSDTDKDNISNRIPSPASLSSLNSAKQPLEWDSGADVGYHFTLHSNSVKTGCTNDDKIPANDRNTETPIANSTPNTLKTDHEDISKDLHENLYLVKDRLSKSLDQLDNISCIDKSLKHHLSYNKRNYAIKCNVNYSSSSASTIIPVNLMKSDKITNKHTKQSIDTPEFNQKLVVDNYLNLKNVSSEYIDNDKICNNEKTSKNTNDSNIRTYLYYNTTNAGDLKEKGGGSSNTTENINTSECFSGSDSFKYVSGTVYENRELKKNSINNASFRIKSANYSNHESGISSETENDSRIYNGVKLITHYIDQLNTINKNKIQRKIGEILINDKEVTSVHKARDSSNLIRDTSTKTEVCDLYLSENNFKNPEALKKYLDKEREIQITWIKSGTDYLNTLKKLFRSQEELRKRIIANEKDQLKSSKQNILSSSTDLTSGTTQTNGIKIVKENGVKTTSSQTSSSLLFTKLNKKKNSSSNNTVTDKLTFHKCHLSELSSYLSSCELTNSTYSKPISEKKTSHSDKLSKTTNLKSDWINRNERINVNNVLTGGSAFCQCCRKFIKNPTCVNCQQTCKPSLSYTVSFTTRSSTEKSKFKNRPATKNGFMQSNQSERSAASKIQHYPWMGKSLQDYLIQNRPEYVQCAEIRQRCLTEIAYLRDLRGKTKRELVDLLDNSDEDIGNCVKRIIPPPALSAIRIFDTKTMKKQTEEKYRRLPEVLENELKKNKEKMYQTNRAMKKIFTKKLQRKVLKGQMNLSNSASVISG